MMSMTLDRITYNLKQLHEPIQNNTFSEQVKTTIEPIFQQLITLHTKEIVSRCDLKAILESPYSDEDPLYTTLSSMIFPPNRVLEQFIICLNTNSTYSDSITSLSSTSSLAAPYSQEPNGSDESHHPSTGALSTSSHVLATPTQDRRGFEDSGDQDSISPNNSYL